MTSLVTRLFFFVKYCIKCHVEEEWDRLDQEVIDNVISEWRKRLTACVAAGRGHFEHSRLTLLHLFTY